MKSWLPFISTLSTLYGLNYLYWAGITFMIRKRKQHQDMLILQSKGKQNQSPRSMYFFSFLFWISLHETGIFSIICEYEKDYFLNIHTICCEFAPNFHFFYLILCKWIVTNFNFLFKTLPFPVSKVSFHYPQDCHMLNHISLDLNYCAPSLREERFT